MTGHGLNQMPILDVTHFMWLKLMGNMFPIKKIFNVHSENTQRFESMFVNVCAWFTLPRPLLSKEFWSKSFHHHNRHKLIPSLVKYKQNKKTTFCTNDKSNIHVILQIICSAQHGETTNVQNSNAHFRHQKSKTSLLHKPSQLKWGEELPPDLSWSQQNSFGDPS